MGMNNILAEKEGSKITAYDVIGYNQFRCRGEQQEDEVFIVYRDAEGKKKVRSIKDPPMEIYFVKPEYRSGFRTSREYLPVDMLYSAKVPSRSVLRRVYDEMKQSTDQVAQQLNRVYQNAQTTRQFGARKEIFKWPYTLFSDCAVEDYYWIQVGVHYNLMETAVLDKCFGDIENDIYGLNSSEQRMNMDPVNAVTLIFQFDETGPMGKTKTKAFTFLLRNHKRYPQQKYFEEHLDEFYAECHKHFDRQTAIKKRKKMVIDTPADYEIKMYDTEAELLTAVFDTINLYKPDLCEFWNMPYDMPKMKARMEILGLDPVRVMSDGDFFPENAQFVQFHMDNRPLSPGDKNSYIRMTSTTQYVDQMQNYAGIRKGRKSFGSSALDNISNIELGLGKWKFKKGVDVTNACIKDYWNFVLYNIRDVWCQVLIDHVTNDSLSLIYDMNVHNCPLYHLFKQTKYQKQIYYAWYFRKGFIPGNNINVEYLKYESEEEQQAAEEARRRRQLRQMLDQVGLDPDDIDEEMLDPDTLESMIEDRKAELAEEQVDEELNDIAESQIAAAVSDGMAVFNDSIDRKLPLPGGLVGNPDNNMATGTELIPGIFSKHVFDDTMDEDYSSEYPWEKYTRSMSRSTQIGRLVIERRVSKYQNLLPLGQQKRKEDNRAYIPGAEFTSDYISQDYLSFGAAWFNLPLVDECNDIIDRMLAGMSVGEAVKPQKQEVG